MLESLPKLLFGSLESFLFIVKEYNLGPVLKRGAIVSNQSHVWNAIAINSSSLFDGAWYRQFYSTILKDICKGNTAGGWNGIIT